MNPDTLAIKKVTQRAAKAAGGTKALDEFGCRQQRLSDLTNLDHPHVIRATEAALLDDLRMDRAQPPFFARYFAQRQGYVLVRLPEMRPSLADWHGTMAAMSKEASDVIQRVCEALPNGVTPAEIRALKIREEIAEAQEQLAALDALAAQVLEEGAD